MVESSRRSTQLGERLFLKKEKKKGKGRSAGVFGIFWNFSNWKCSTRNDYELIKNNLVRCLFFNNFNLLHFVYKHFFFFFVKRRKGIDIPEGIVRTIWFHADADSDRSDRPREKQVDRAASEVGESERK